MGGAPLPRGQGRHLRRRLRKSVVSSWAGLLGGVGTGDPATSPRLRKAVRTFSVSSRRPNSSEPAMGVPGSRLCPRRTGVHAFSQFLQTFTSEVQLSHACALGRHGNRPNVEGVEPSFAVICIWRSQHACRSEARLPKSRMATRCRRKPAVSASRLEAVKIAVSSRPVSSRPGWTTE